MTLYMWEMETIERARKEGIREENTRIVKALLQKDLLSLEKISSIAQIPLQEVAALKKECEPY